MENKENKKYVVAIQFYFEDGWYGTRRRYIYAGEDGNGFDSKREARTHTSMLKKFLKKELRIEEAGMVEIGVEKEMETYRYMGAGPSWSCSNVHINVERFERFVEKEKVRLEDGKKRREWEAENRQTRAGRTASMRRGRIARG